MLTQEEDQQQIERTLVTALNALDQLLILFLG